MSQFQSWTALIFIINIYSIFGTDDPNKPVKRPWLDLNHKPKDLLEPPAPILRGQRPRLDLKLDPQELSESPEDIVNISDENTETGAQIQEGGTSSDYNSARQMEMEKLFKESGQIWDELRSDLDMKDGKWMIICEKMLKKWKVPEGPLKIGFCYSYPYFIEGSGKRRIKYKEIKKRRKGCRNFEAPDLLSCQCFYFQSENDTTAVAKEEYFAIKHYQENEYFLLVKQQNTSNVVYWVNNIHTLVISSQSEKDKT